MKKTGSQTNKAKQPFNPKDYERPGVSTEEVLEIREAFDLFDYEGHGYIDAKGTPFLI
jgi:glycine cleavage system aminomethyltransferase T